MKDFNIAKYLRENSLGSHAILGRYVDLHALKEEEVGNNKPVDEVPYVGAEKKLDGFGDEFDQVAPVEEANKNHKFKVVIPVSGVTRNQLQFMADNDIDVEDISDGDDWDNQKNLFTAPNEEVLKLMIAKFYPKRLGLGKEEVINLINTIEPITAPVEEAEMGENAWMEDVDGTDAYKVGNWTCYYDHPGLLVWSYGDTPLSQLAVYATPNYDGDDTTPIQIDVNGENDDMMALNQGIFADFNEYARAMKPYLDRIEDLESNWGSLAPVEEIDNSVTGDKGWQYDDEDFSSERDKLDRMMGLAHEYFEKVSPIVRKTIDALRADGFDDQDIMDFLATDFTLEEEVSVSSSGVQMEGEEFEWKPVDQQNKHPFKKLFVTITDDKIKISADDGFSSQSYTKDDIKKAMETGEFLRFRGKNLQLNTKMKAWAKS